MLEVPTDQIAALPDWLYAFVTPVIGRVTLKVKVPTDVIAKFSILSAGLLIFCTVTSCPTVNPCAADVVYVAVVPEIVAETTLANAVV